MEETKAMRLNKLKIRLENGVFRTFDGGGKIPVSRFTPTSITWEKWIGKVYADGSIRLKAHLYPIGTPEEEQTYVLFKLTRAGYINLYQKTGKQQQKEIYCKKISWPQDGIITLTDGDLEERHAFFTQKAYADFLERHSIEGVKQQNPNKEYLIYNMPETREFRWIYTDGQVRQVRQKFDGARVAKVNNASWVITIRRRGDEEKRNLYTLLPIEQLQDIPEI